MSTDQDSAATEPTVRRIAWAAAAVTVLCRLPFVARRLWDHDSVQFALGVEGFDLAAHHPHPPGYPLYIGLLKFLGFFGIEPLAGMVGLCLIASGFGAAAIVALTARLVREGSVREGSGNGREAWMAGGLAGLLFAVHPILWFYSELPLVYAVEGAMTVLIAWSCRRARDGLKELATCAVLYGVAAGIRPSTVVLLSPLLLFALVRAWRAGNLTLGRLLVAAAAGAATIGVWAIPMLVEVGGLSAYREASGNHFGALLPATSVLFGAGMGALQHNLFVTVKWTIQGLVPAFAVYGLLAVFDPRGIVRGLARLRPSLAFLLFWSVPPALFFVLFHITKAGYTLIFQPAILVAIACASGALVRTRPVRFGAALALAALIGGSLFLFGTDRRPEEPNWTALVKHRFQRDRIKSFERSLDETLAAVRRFDPETTVLVALELSGQGDAGAEGFLYPWHRHLQWYLPEYTTVYLIPEQERAWMIDRGHQPMRPVGTEIELPGEAERLVFVLAERPLSRFRMMPGSIEAANDDFFVLRTPLPEDGRLGPYRLSRSAFEADDAIDADHPSRGENEAEETAAGSDR